ncbi:sigma-70 family RNA polymerase sigma factor [Enterovibrio norvegicus]|uniref:sigma-70 family RNA polymerase sigma factor n=1 Tax=Enterovibrio norvegicus TaxID=188144 RepID=UPI000CC77815|nr:sigma-70 family RNA polymerase sigma factor [Enterovibrio norvegicus]PMH64558.1 hypothetical protein BCU62_16005 [Enterovibrio norvegicus]
MTDILEQYFEQVESVSVMTRTEEEALYAYLKDDSVKNKLVESNIRIALKHAHRFSKISPKYNLADLVGEANLGLVIAVQKFDPSKGFRFNTYAEHWILNRLRAFVSDNYSIVRKPQGKFYQAIKASKLATRNIDDDQICAELNISSDQLLQLQSWFTFTHGTDHEFTHDIDNNYYELQCIPADTDTDDLLAAIEHDQLMDILINKCDTLSVAEKECVDALYGLNQSERMSTKELSCLIGKSESTIKNLRRRTVAKFRNRLEELREIQEGNGIELDK